MSYELNLYLPECAIKKKVRASYQLGFNSINTDWPSMPNPIKAIQNERVVDELCDLFPQIDVLKSTFEYVMFDTDATKVIELSVLNGPQVSLYNTKAVITVPYWYKHEHLVRIGFNHVRKCIAVIEDNLEYITYDPQIDRIVTMPDDLNDMMEAYLHTIGLIQKHIS